MTTRTLHLAQGLNLPLETVTEKLAWMGRTGSGKTYGATKLAELMLVAGAQVIALDPVGVWAGLRIGDVALPIYVFGGLRKDYPLEPTAGAVLADVVVDRGISAVFDVSQFGTDTEHRRFATDFLTRFFQRKKAAPSAVHVFLEECQEFAPQDKQHGDEAMLHATQRIWKQGRNFGIGGSLISQRPQDVNKKVLEMTGTMFAFETTGPNAKKAIAGWMDAHDVDTSVADLLPTLKQGEPYVWSPTFLKVQRIVQILPKATADVSSTPKVGSRAKLQPLTPIDVAQLEEQMAATVEKAKADDPRELRRQIAELRKELASKSSVPVSKEKISNRPVLTDGDRAQLDKLSAGLSNIREFLTTGHAHLLDEAHDRLVKTIGLLIDDSKADVLRMRTEFERRLDTKGVQQVLDKLRTVQAVPITLTQSFEPRPPTDRLKQARRALAADTAPAEGLDAAQQKILDVVAMLGLRGIDANRDSVARWLTLHPNGGRYGTNLGRLRAAGYLDGFQLTDSGLRAARAMPTGLDAAKDPLDGPTREIVDVLDAHKGQRFTRETLAEALGLHPNGGRYGTNLGRLRTMGLIPERGEIYLTEGAYR